MDLRDTRMDLTDQAVSVLTHYPGLIFIACAIVGSGIVAYAVTRWMESRRPRDEEAEMKRKAKLDEMYLERFGDVLFNAYIKGEITGKEYRRDCRRFGVAYRFPFSLTWRNKERVRRAKIIKNCAENHATPSLAGKIPGPKPGEGQSVIAMVIKPARKVWVVQGSAKLRRTAV